MYKEKIVKTKNSCNTVLEDFFKVAKEIEHTVYPKQLIMRRVNAGYSITVYYPYKCNNGLYEYVLINVRKGSYRVRIHSNDTEKIDAAIERYCHVINKVLY